jgi:hypothetical protein
MSVFSGVHMPASTGRTAGNGRIDMDVASLSELLHETSNTPRLVRGGRAAARLVGTGTRPTWTLARAEALRTRRLRPPTATWLR